MKAVGIWRRQKANYAHLGREGKVVTKTRIIEAPKGFSGRYWVVMVEVNPSAGSGQVARVVGQWADRVEPKMEMKVVGVVRRVDEGGKSGVIEYGVKWKKG